MGIKGQLTVYSLKLRGRLRKFLILIPGGENLAFFFRQFFRIFHRITRFYERSLQYLIFCHKSDQIRGQHQFLLLPGFECDLASVRLHKRKCFLTFIFHRSSCPYRKFFRCFRYPDHAQGSISLNGHFFSAIHLDLRNFRILRKAKEGIFRFFSAKERQLFQTGAGKFGSDAAENSHRICFRLFQLHLAASGNRNVLCLRTGHGRFFCHDEKICISSGQIQAVGFFLGKDPVRPELFAERLPVCPGKVFVCFPVKIGVQLIAFGT